jgi:multiple sugar transport system substrate-binding protein
MTLPNSKKILVTSSLAFLAIVPAGCNRANIKLPFVKPPEKQIELTYWGLFEPEEVMQPLIEEYQKLHPNVTINYQPRNYSSLADYKETLLTRLREGTAPDIARIHATWVPQFAAELAPLPADVFSKGDFAATFYPVAVDSLTTQGQIYGLPLMYDGLLLFYNRDHFKEAKIDHPPADWDEFATVAKKLTKKDEKGNIIRAGAAMGTTQNVAHFADILGLMWAQSRVELPSGLSSPQARDALIFYTGFASKDTDKVWDGTLPFSVSAFAIGKVSMIFAPSWRVFDIQNSNPGLKFGVAAVPQVPSLPGQESQRVNWASFWAEAVNKDSENAAAAWDFLKFLSDAENMQQLYSEEAKLREFGEPYSRVDLGQSLLTSDYLAPLIDGANSAVTAPITDASGNDVYVDAVAEAVDAAAQGKDITAALETLQKTLERF